MVLDDTIVPSTLGGSYVYMANTVAAFLGKKAYPYLPAVAPKKVDFKKFTMEQAANLDLDAHCQSFLSVYASFVKNRKFPAIIFGAPNGGIVNLAIAMNAPYLCSQFRTPIIIESEEGTKNRDDLRPYVQAVDHIGGVWASKYRWASTSCLVDPIHDRMDIGEYAHLREKFTEIPTAFKQFLREHLQPNGAIVFVNTTYPWLSYRIRDDVYLQIGGLGEISPNEYLTGSERIRRFLEAEKSDNQGGWQLPDYEAVQRPESEWGTQPELKQAVQQFCHEYGYDFLLLEQNHPAGFNLLAAEALHKKHTADGGRCGGFSINIFWGLCSALVLRARLLGCWFTFTDSASMNISEQQLRVLIGNFPDVPQKAVMGYYWSYPGARLLDVVPPKGWLSMLSKYIPAENISTPGLTDLNSTEHNIFQYEDALFEESKKFEGKESRHTVTVQELHDIMR